MNTSDKIVELEAQKQDIIQKQISYARKKEIEDLFHGSKHEIKSITDDGAIVITSNVRSIYRIETYKTSIYYLTSILPRPDGQSIWEFKRDWSKDGKMEIML